MSTTSTFLSRLFTVTRPMRLGPLPVSKHLEMGHVPTHHSKVSSGDPFVPGHFRTEETKVKYGTGGLARLSGTVVKRSGDKTVAVVVERMQKLGKLKAVVPYHRKFLVHDERNECVVGDVVRLANWRPISKRKHHIVEKIIKPNLAIGFGKDVGMRHEVHPNPAFRVLSQTQIDFLKQVDDAKKGKTITEGDSSQVTSKN